MNKCSACERPAETETVVPCCAEHRRLVTGLLASMRPGVLEPGVELSPERQACLLKMQEMVRELAEASFIFSSPDLGDGQLESVFARVDEMWLAFLRGRGGNRKRLHDLLN